MKKLLVISAVAASLTLGACASTPTAKSEYDATVEKATMAHAEAKKMGNVWKQKKMKMSYAEDYLAKAAEAKAKGDEAAALKFAKEALKTAEAEVEQSMKYADVKPGWYK
ncbi:hypothetical protein [Thiosulfativibrio zosterae]|uniref:SoxXA-binding protein n=1 Tax=Thiosulfativibrio zosterae TaxID=2675053 RepID=A0A6F8PLW7_9GAMM|nr:hypothetical protein [Thiosulfativibrio zosterae]BBP43037.1 hypothetical protein THMIRHAT_07830 [Thiosulfativibrio zosterae]